MITKQQQLEWLANNLEKWKYGYDYAVVEKAPDGYLYIRWPSVCTSGITKKEWRQERDKMQKQQDNSWHERGELPPVGATVEKKCKSATIWTEIKIVAAGNQLVIFGYPAGDESVGEWSDYEFRPLRAEREKAIDELNALVGDIEKYPTWRDAITGIIDAGYRKQ